MSLTMLRNPDSGPVQRNFLVYDFEWVPGTLQMRLCGLFDGKRYRCYETVDKLLSAMLTSENRGKWFYAHAGGLADVQFVLEAIVKRCNPALYETDDGDMVFGQGDGFQIEARFSGSSAIIVKVSQGKNCWHFVDSYWLLRESLKKIGKSIGLSKLGPAEEGEEDYSEEKARKFYAEAPLHELMIYNERDCVILWKAIDAFENSMREMQSPLQMTLASTGMSMFRRNRRYLKRDIETNPYVNERVRDAYFASRVEVFNRYGVGKYYFDINSSFPYSMTFACPGEMRCINTRVPDNFDSETIYAADVEIEVPENYITPVPYRAEGNRVFFPVGRWRNWLSSVDIQALIEEGGRILKVHEVIHFDPFYDLSDYARDLYAKRKATDDDFERMVWKLLLNSLYGKFAESSLKQSFFYRPSANQLNKMRDFETGNFRAGVESPFPHAYLMEKEQDVPHMHVPISMHITALSRRWLYNYMNMVSDYDYCDTDGFSASELLQTSNELGALKLEKHIKEAEFLAPKCYKIIGTDDKGKDIELYRIKGVTMGKDLHTQRVRWKAITKGGRVSYARMNRIKENIRRRQTLSPLEVLVRKKLKMDAVEKRFMYPDGTTRPWHVDEINRAS